VPGSRRLVHVDAACAQSENALWTVDQDILHPGIGRSAANFAYLDGAGASRRFTALKHNLDVGARDGVVCAVENPTPLKGIHRLRHEAPVQ